MAGEILVSEVAPGQAHIEIGNQVLHKLELKRICEQVSVCVIRGASA